MELNQLLSGSGGLLALGAFLAAGWSHVQDLVQRLYAFVVVEVEFEREVGWDVRSLLKRRWETLPIGDFEYAYVHFRWTRPRPQGGPVPFRMAGYRSYYRRGWKVLMCKLDTDGDMQLYSIRGLVDFRALVAEAFDLGVQLRNGSAGAADDPFRGQGRFHMSRVSGAEKGMASLSAISQMSKSSGDGEEPSPMRGRGGSGGRAKFLDLSADASFHLEKGDYGNEPPGHDPMDGLFFPAEIYSAIREAKRWLSSASWYRERGIPWRRGLLLYGPPGTGKSSLARVIAQALDIPLISFDLATMSNNEFAVEWKNLPTPCVVLFEDFGSVFDGKEPLTEHRSLTLDCVLNHVSGVDSPPGVYLVVTTNDPEKLDPAMGCPSERGMMTRPGRIDRAIHLGAMGPAERRRLAERILSDWPAEVGAALAGLGPEATASQVQEACIEAAWRRMAEVENVDGA